MTIHPIYGIILNAFSELLLLNALRNPRGVAQLGSVSYTHLDVYKRQKQEGGEKESDQDIAERVESTDGGKETLTDGGVDLAETDEAEADPDQKNTDVGTEASGSENSDPEAIELPSSYDIREHRTVSVSDQGEDVYKRQA